MSKLAVVILNWNGKRFLERFLPTLLRTLPDYAEAVVCDNASDDDSIAFLKEHGDLEITGEVTGYSVAAAAVSAQEIATQNRLTVTVRVNFTNRKYPEDDFEGKSFSAYADYDSTNSLDAVESSLCTEIVEKLVEDIFNATVAQW